MPSKAPDLDPMPADVWRRINGMETNGNMPAKPEIPEAKLERLRSELFEKGSEFLFTKRSDIVGVDQVLVEIDDVIHWVKHHRDYQKYESRLEPGIVFEGRPGTGKTLVSRYIASESDALFINVRDWPHNGSLLSDNDIAELFKAARETYAKTDKPIILFWDEFEANACERSNAAPEQQAAVSQLTAELDGIHGKNQGLLLIGCTNYAHAIDAALLRAGRMGLHIEFQAPDRAGKCAILGHYLDATRTKGKIEVETLSYFFDGDATAADIEEACVEAWRYAVRRGIKAGGRSKPALSQVDLMEVFVKRLVGPPTMFINLESEKRARVAVHEVGHAIMALVYGIPLRLITVQPGKKSLGRVIYAEVEEHIGTLDEYVDRIRIALGSIAAESVANVPAGVGTGGDIGQATATAQHLVDQLNYGSNLVNLVQLGETRGAHAMEPPRPNVAERTIEVADQDINTLLHRVQGEALSTMKMIGSEKLWAIANAVNDCTTMTGTEFSERFAELVGTHDFSQFRA